MQTTATVRTSLVLLTLLAATFSRHRSFAQTAATTPEELLKQYEADVAKANADVKTAMDKMNQVTAELKAQNADLAAKLAAISAATTRPAHPITTQPAPLTAEELQRRNADAQTEPQRKPSENSRPNSPPPPNPLPSKRTTQFPCQPPPPTGYTPVEGPHERPTTSPPIRHPGVRKGGETTGGNKSGQTYLQPPSKIYTPHTPSSQTMSGSVRGPSPNLT